MGILDVMGTKEIMAMMGDRRKVEGLKNSLKALYVGNPIFLGLAISDNPIIRDDIIKAYDSIPNIYSYHKKYNMPIVNDLITQFDIERQDICLKVCCLYAYCAMTWDYSKLESILKKGYKKVYKYVTTEEIVTEIGIDFCMNHKQGDAKLNDLYVYSLEIVGAYICYMKDIDFYLTTDSLYNWSLVIIHCSLSNKMEIESIKANKGAPLDISSLISEYLAEDRDYTPDTIQVKDDTLYSKERINELYKKYKVTKKYLNVDMILSEYRHDEMMKVYGDDLGLDYMKVVSEFNKKDPILKNYEYLLGCIRASGLYTLSFSTKNLEREEVTFCLIALEDYRKQIGLSVEEAHKLLPTILLMYTLCKEYKKAGKIGVLNEIENKALETNKIYDEYSKKLNEIEEKQHMLVNRAEKAESKLRDKEEELLSRIRELEKENTRLKDDLSEYETIKREVNGLKSALVEQVNNEEIPDTSFEHMIYELNTKDIVVIGGNPQWVKKMEEVLPKAKFINFKYIKSHLNSIIKRDCIYLNVEYFNHPSYYKLLDSLNGTNVKVKYLKGYSNIERSVKEIYEYEV